MSECCNSFTVVPNIKGKDRLGLDLAWLNKALIRPILPKPTGVKYCTMIDASFTYHNITWWKTIIFNDIFLSILQVSIHKTTVQNNTSRWYVPKEDRELFNDIPNVFVMADDILIAGFDADSRDHDARLEQVLWRCRQANLKLNKEKCFSG